VARPSKNIDQLLLHSGRNLYSLHGCAGLSVRQLCEHAGVNVGMFHYHFQSKNNFLNVLLQHLYEEVFAQVQAQVAQPSSALQRLRQALNRLAQLMREHGQWVSRVWTDAGSGDAVAQEFLRRNAPRHMQLLMGLAQEAVSAGELAVLPPLQGFGFMMGAVLAPMVLMPSALRMGLLPAALSKIVESDVTSDAAIAQRVDRALAALTQESTHA
jgi:AcrR family transcriptional regulator